MDIKIDATDWAEDYEKEEPKIKSKTDLIVARQQYHAADVAKYTLIARERGDAESDIVKPNKLLLLSGAVLDIAQYVASATRTIVIGEGDNARELDIREYIAPVKNGDDEDSSDAPIISTEGEQAVEFARRYLLKDVIGRVRGRLEIFAGNGESVREIAQEFVDEVWRVVEGLEPQGE